MGKLRWYRRDPQAALDGMLHMTLEETGAYNKILDLIYMRDGAVPDDPAFICRWLNCDPRVWKRLRQRLIDLGKLYVEGVQLRNKRADTEVVHGLARLEQQVEAGRSRAAKSPTQTSKNKDLAPAPAGINKSKSKTVTDEAPSQVPPVTETGPSSTPIGVAVPATADRSARAVLWSEMKLNLGVPGKEAGSIVGGWCKKYGEGKVFEAHTAAMRAAPADYHTWMVRRLEVMLQSPESKAGGVRGNYDPLDIARQTAELMGFADNGHEPTGLAPDVEVYNAADPGRLAPDQRGPGTLTLAYSAPARNAAR